MSTRAYSQPSDATESSALEMHWVTEGGRLRSRWIVAEQPKPVKTSRLVLLPDPKNKALKTGTFGEPILYLVGTLCSIIILLLS